MYAKYEINVYITRGKRTNARGQRYLACSSRAGQEGGSWNNCPRKERKTMKTMLSEIPPAEIAVTRRFPPRVARRMGTF